jgi:hypothetical protein
MCNTPQNQQGIDFLDNVALSVDAGSSCFSSSELFATLTRWSAGPVLMNTLLRDERDRGIPRIK